MAFNTGNPIGSTDPRDFSDNSENLDRAVNNTASATWTDRLGNTRTSLAGQIGYIGTGADGAIEDYAAGQELGTFSTIIRYSGEFYRPAAGATLPYTTTATTPDVDANLVPVGDATLRQDLADNNSLVGSDLVAHTGTSDTATEALNKRTVYIDSVAEGFAGLTGLADAAYKAVAWHPGGAAQVDPKGGGHFVYRSGVAKTEHNGITVISPTVPAASLQAGASVSAKRDNFLAGAGETDAAGSGCFVRNLDEGATMSVYNAGAYGDDTNDDKGAFDAITELGLPVKEGAGDFVIQGDWVVSKSYFGFEGSGAETYLKFVDGGLIFDATVLASGFLEFLSFHNFQIRRDGVAGPAFYIQGTSGAGNPDVIRSNFSNIWIQRSTGEGVKIRFSYLHTFHGFFVTNTELAWDVRGGNALSIVGGETQANTKAGLWNNVVGISFSGHTTEGNDQGHEIIGDSRAFNYKAGYFEKNALADVNGYDFKIGGTGDPQCRCIEISGNLITTETATRTSSIYWVNAISSSCFSNTYSGFTYPHNMSLAENVAGCRVWSENYGINTNWVDSNPTGFANGYRLTKEDTSVYVKTLDFSDLAPQSFEVLEITDIPCSPGDRITLHLPASLSAVFALEFDAVIDFTNRIKIIAYNRSTASNNNLPSSDFVIELTRI